MKIGITVLGIAAIPMLLATVADAALDDAKALELLKKGGCAACHSVEKKGIGPSFKDVAQKRKGEAITLLTKAVRSGGKGAYGSMPMPPTAPDKISDTDLQELIGWILKQ
jgi:cytochrome c